MNAIAAAKLFLMARGRIDHTHEDRDALAQLLTEFAKAGLRAGLMSAKELFRESTDAKGGCKLLSEGDNCHCCLCLIDNQIRHID